jgi:hypothetical protein
VDGVVLLVRRFHGRGEGQLADLKVLGGNVERAQLVVEAVRGKAKPLGDERFIGRRLVIHRAALGRQIGGTH